VFPSSGVNGDGGGPGGVAAKPAMRKPVFTKVDQLKPGTSGHTLTVKVVSSETVLHKGRAVPSSANLRRTRIAERLVGDETGTIVFTARNEQGEPLKAALLLNYDPTGPSRLLSVMRDKIKLLTCYVPNFFKRKNWQMEFFSLGPNQYMVTSTHKHWFCARCVNTSKPDKQNGDFSPCGLTMNQYAGMKALLVRLHKQWLQLTTWHGR
ncbi:Uncharacterized protein ACMD2_15189, partial [Ananas comosus]